MAGATHHGVHHDGGRLRDEALPHGDVGAGDALHAAGLAQPLPGALHNHLHTDTETSVRLPGTVGALQPPDAQRIDYARSCTAHSAPPLPHACELSLFDGSQLP